MGKRKVTFWDSARLNNLTYQIYYQRLLGIALSMFEWHNLPDSIDPRFLELVLFADGKALFFKDEVMGYLTLQVMLGGNLDVYRIPMDRNAFSANGYTNKLGPDNSVIIWNNMMHTNSFTDIDTTALRLYDIQRTIDVNIKAQKTPVAILANENERLTMKNLYMQYDGNEPFIFGDKDLQLDQIKVIRTDAPYIADKLFDAKRDIWNEALSSLGVPVSANAKRERLISAEVSGDTSASMVQQYIRLNPRKEACKQINKMFGLNIDVTYRDLDYMGMLPGSEGGMAGKEPAKEGEQNG